MNPRQRRGLLLVVLAVGVAVVVFASVLQYTAEVSRELGPRRAVLVVTQQAAGLEPVDPGRVTSRSVPEIFVPPSALGSAEELAGKVARTTLPAGAYIQAHDLIDPPLVEPGQREVTLDSDTELTLGGTIRSGDQVDVVVTVSRGYQQAARTWQIQDLTVVGVTTAGSNLAVRLAVPQRQAVRLAGARAQGASLAITRIPDSETGS